MPRVFCCFLIFSGFLMGSVLEGCAPTPILIPLNIAAAKGIGWVMRGGSGGATKEGHSENYGGSSLNGSPPPRQGLSHLRQMCSDWVVGRIALTHPMAEAIPIIENMVVAESSTHTLGAQPRMWSLIGSECAQLSEKDYSKLEFSCGGEDAECSEKRAFAQKYEAVLQEWKNGGAVSVQQKFRLLIENEKKLLKKSL